MEIVLKRPYFLEDESWFYYDYEELRYKLTDKAPKEAVESYNEFYKKVLESE